MTIKDKAYASGFLAQNQRFRRDYGSKRYAIKLNGITGRYVDYEDSMTLGSRELIPDGEKATMIAIYVGLVDDKYGADTEYSFELLINGEQRFDITPVNHGTSSEDDVIFIRKDVGQEPLMGTAYVEDYIISAVLTIKATYHGVVTPITDIRVVREMEEELIVQ